MRPHASRLGAQVGSGEFASRKKQAPPTEEDSRDDSNTWSPQRERKVPAHAMLAVPNRGGTIYLETLPPVWSSKERDQ
jgi:hypothetical protein